MLGPINISFVVAGFVFLFSACLKADEGEIAKESAGYLQAFHANAQGLDSYQAFLVFYESGIKPDDSALQVHQLCLISVDLAEHKYCMLMREKREENGGHATCFTCLINESGKQRMLACDGKERTLLIPRLNVTSIPDLRLTGHKRFLYPHVDDLFESLDGKYSPARPFRLTKPLGQENMVRIELPVVIGVNKLKYEHSWTMDTERLVPTKYSNQFFGPLDQKWLQQTNESYEWAEKNNVQLPTSVIGRRLRGMESGPLYGKGYTTDYDATIHWLKVNEKVSEEVFDFNSWKDQKKIANEIKKLATRLEVPLD